MAESSFRSKRKPSGGRYHAFRTKRGYELKGYPANTKIAVRKATTKRSLGGSYKQNLLSTKQINVSDKKGKTQVVELVTVVENTANPNLVRRNILTKGAVVETKLGKVRITSRPGQVGTVNGILV